MTIYTGVADGNGDFSISFGANSYTSGEKIIVTAEKDSAEKSIELFAPASVLGGGVIRFSGNMVNFPNNIGNITLGPEISGVLQQGAFEDKGSYQSVWGKASGLTIQGAVTQIGTNCFKNWGGATFLNLPGTLVSVGNNAFDSWSSLLELAIPNSVTTIGSSGFGFAGKCKKLEIGTGIQTIGVQGFAYYSQCDVVIIHATTPPLIQSNTFQSLNPSCLIKVPAASVAAYQAAPNWSAFASRIQAI